MLEKIKSEPVLVVALVQALLGLSVAFGLDLTDVQIGAVLAVTSAGLGFIARSRVSPVDNSILGKAVAPEEPEGIVPAYWDGV